MKNIEKEIEKKRMNVFNIRSVDDSLRLGQLKGNHFDIVIRNLKKQINDSANLRERIMEAIENVKVRKLNFKRVSREIFIVSFSTLRQEGKLLFLVYLFMGFLNTIIIF